MVDSVSPSPGSHASSDADLTRRSLIGAAAALGGAALVGASGPPETSTTGLPARAGGGGPGPKVVVVGAGAFGGWTALALARGGAQVTLVDAWGAGHSRASSGGDSRVVRGMYGPDRIYTDWAARALGLWKDHDRAWGGDLYHPTGALWLFRGDDDYARDAAPFLADAGLPVARVDPAEAARRWPGVRFEGARAVWLEEDAGFVVARRACQRVAAAVADEGGRVLRAAVVPPGPLEGPLREVRLADGSRLAAEAFVFACGPWLGGLFPDVVGWRVRPTRQEVFYFGTPPGDAWSPPAFPVWIDFGERVFYGIPDNEARGFKVADDTHGEPVDPTSQERMPTAEPLRRARGLLAERFPALAGAPLVEARVCQYENTPDGHYILDRHPAAPNVWIAGGGSGHGFKMGPVVGEHVAALVRGEAEPIERFALGRFPEEDPGEGATRSQLRGKENR